MPLVVAKNDCGRWHHGDAGPVLTEVSSTGSGEGGREIIRCRSCDKLRASRRRAIELEFRRHRLPRAKLKTIKLNRLEQFAVSYEQL